MTQNRRSWPEVNVQKATTAAIVVNAMQILVVVGFALYISLTDYRLQNPLVVRVMAVCGALMASWGALIDIREAMRMRGRNQQIADLQTTNDQMETLNRTLRMQRHDFLNHLQVVYSLLEMQEYRDATEYLEKVYGDIRAVSTVLKTHCTAVNALLKVKLGAAQEKGIAFALDIKSTLEGLPMPSWELCRVLSNLIDNAMDAMAEGEDKRMLLAITEDLRQYTFTVCNHGAPIPPDMLTRIFEPGVTTKSQGHGMGLYIVSQTLRPYGGHIDCESDESGTRFVVTLPKTQQDERA